MIKFETVGRNSIFTRLDFRSKLYMVLVVTVIAFLWESPWMQFALAVLLIAFCLFAGVRPSYIRTVLVLMFPFYLFILLTHMFFNRDHVMVLQGYTSVTQLQKIFIFPENWFLLGGGFATWDGLRYGFNVILKTLILTMVIPLAVFTTEVDNMIVSMVKARVPYKLAFIFSSTLRFFPLLIVEFKAILEAQRLRGLAIEKMKLIPRVRLYASVAVPLILNTMVKSQQLEVVLQSKAFSGDADRSYLHESTLSISDYLLMIAFTISLVIAVILYIIYGVGKFGGPI